MNEFKTDIDSEREKIDLEILRATSQITALKDSKDNLTKMTVKLNELAVGCEEAEQLQLIGDFKQYLRGKIAQNREADYDKSLKMREKEKRKRTAEKRPYESGGEFFDKNLLSVSDRGHSSGGFSRNYQKEDARMMHKESEWL